MNNRLLAVLVHALLLLPALLAAVVALLGDAVATLLGRAKERASLRPPILGEHDGAAKRSAPQPPTLGESSSSGRSASIIIVNWNGRDLLAQGLPSVLAAVQQDGGDHEVIVVDNGSSDGSVAFVRTAFPTVRLVELPTNLGFSRGNNAGVQAAVHDIVVLLNNDMVVDPGFLSPLLAPFADQRVFAVSAQIRMGDPQRERVETGLTLGEIVDGRLHVRHGDIGENERMSRPCLWAGGGSAAFDRRRFLALGGFHPLYAPFYVEDVDLSYRAWARGWHVLLAPASVVYHRHRSSTSRLGRAYVERALAKNQRLFVWHNVHDAAWTVQSMLRLPGDLARALRAGDTIEKSAIAWALRQLPAALVCRWRERWQRACRPGMLPGENTASLADRDIWRVACSRYHYKERFVPPPAPPIGGRKTILIVCPYLPAPPAHGGAVRMLSLIKNLSQRNNVDVLSFIDSEAERAFAEQITPYCRRLRMVLRRLPIGRFDPLRDRSWHIEEFDTPEMRQALLEMMGEEDYHIVQIEYTQMASYHPRSRRCRTALDEVDLTFRAFYRREIAGRRPPAAQDIVDYLKIVRFEVESCRRFDRVLAMSQSDAACLAGYLPEHAAAIVEIANGVDTAYYTPLDAWPGGAELLFVGSFRHTPNQDGLRFFLREVWPLIRRDVPDARLTIVGDGPWADMPEAAADNAVTATGFVEDTRPFFARCAVSVAPIRAGAGTRIKILDSLAAGAPVVSTTLGCEGIAVQPGTDVLIADSAPDFAAAVVRVLGDPALAETLRRNGRRLAAATYDWRAIVGQLDSVLDKALEEAQ